MTEMPVTPWSSDRFADAVLEWFDRHGRTDLPWQLDPSPYRVWVSEIMLQQTQVAVVIPYFERFIGRFPDLQSLAEAPQQDVLRYWSGLGYYARARNLHRAAQLARDTHQGRLPDQLALLQALPGIGRSTAGAILSLALGQPHPILDGNVKRVLTRCFAIPGWPGQAKVQGQLWTLASELTPSIAPGDQHPGNRVAAYNQAMMDLGATLCTRRKSACHRCPLASGCLARAQGNPSLYPAPKPKRQRPSRQTTWLVIQDPEGRILLERRPPQGLWGGLMTLPEVQNAETIDAWCRHQFGVGTQRVEKLPPRRHSFSHFDLEIHPVLIALSKTPGMVAEDDGWSWTALDATDELPLPAPVKRLLEDLRQGRAQTQRDGSASA